jgi:peptide/nickel transport system permease protein
MKRAVRILQRILNPRADLSHLTIGDGGLSDDVHRPRRSRWKAVMQNPALMIGSFIVLVLFFVTLFGPLWAPQNPYLTGRPIVTHFDPKLGKLIDPPLPPSPENLLGTDRWGIDLLSLLLHGARNTLVACTFIAMVRILIGVFFGGLAGWSEGGAVDQIIMGSISVITAVPILISSIFIIYALDIRRGLPVFIIALSLVGWTEIAQYIRSEFLVLKKMPFIEGARSAGLQGYATAVRHVLPNILPALLVITFLELGAVMMLLGELGFIGVFIGGGTRISIVNAADVREIFELVEVPEWGAMLADGMNFLRTKPFVVFPPALAFFIAVVGFNTLGEGLRRHVSETGMSTSFLLKKRMLLVILAVTASTVYIINRTGPSPWFTKVAQSFNGERALGKTEVLAQMAGRGLGQQGAEEAASHIQAELERYGIAPGWTHNTYIYTLDAELVRPLEQPAFRLIAADGSAPRAYRHQVDFSFSLEGHGGSGFVEGPLTFVGFTRGEELAQSDYRGLDLRGKVVLLQAGNAPGTFPTEALIRGALGVVWITAEEAAELNSQMLFLPGDKDKLRHPQIPIFNIRPSVAREILGEAGLAITDLFTFEDGEQTGDRGWFTRDIPVKVSMSVALRDPVAYPVQNVLGYLRGSDFDHAGELVILLANYDGLGVEPDGTVFTGSNHNASGTALLLEIAHLWQEERLEPRRPVLFLFWGAGTQAFLGLEEFLGDRSNLEHLITANPNSPLVPSLIMDLDFTGAGEPTIQVDGEVSGAFEELLRSAAGELDLPIVIPRTPAPGRINPSGPGTSSSMIGWAQRGMSPAEDSFERLNEGQMQDFGQFITLALARILRQTEY